MCICAVTLLIITFFFFFTSRANDQNLLQRQSYNKGTAHTEYWTKTYIKFIQVSWHLNSNTRRSMEEVITSEVKSKREATVMRRIEAAEH